MPDEEIEFDKQKAIDTFRKITKKIAKEWITYVAIIIILLLVLWDAGKLESRINECRDYYHSYIRSSCYCTRTISGINDNSSLSAMTSSHTLKGLGILARSS